MVTQLDDIELPVDSTIASQIEPTNPTIEVESPMSIQLLESDIVNDPRECTDTEKVRPTNLVLTEEPLKTPPTVVENLEEDLVTQELMSSGELSTATNASLNSTQMYSPVDNWDNVQEGLETVKESQKSIESTLTHIVDSILNVKQELSMISKDQLQSKISVEQDHLGLTMNRTLNFTEHVILLYNKANQRFGLLKRTCHFIDNTARRRVLYLSMVRSIFEHCPTVWRPSAYTATNKLETIKKRAIKWINQNYSVSYSSNHLLYYAHCKQQKILPVRYRFDYHDLKLFHLIVHA